MVFPFGRYAMRFERGYNDCLPHLPPLQLTEIEIDDDNVNDDDDDDDDELDHIWTNLRLEPEF